MTSSIENRRQLVSFVGIVFLVSIPFWVAGAISKATVTGSLSVGSLMVIAPFVAAVVLTGRTGGWSAVRRLIIRAIDPRLPRGARWHVAALGLMPLALLIEVALLRLTGHAVPPFQIVPLAVASDFAVFWIAATLEEVGWSGYATDRLQARFSALSTGLVLGGIWAAWHVIAIMEMPAGHDAGWVILQCANQIIVRVLIVWLYNASGGSVFAAAMLHTTLNVTTLSLFPVNGSHYDPLVADIVLMVVALVVTRAWRGRLARRGAQAPRDVESAAGFVS